MFIVVNVEIFFIYFLKTVVDYYIKIIGCFILYVWIDLIFKKLKKYSKFLNFVKRFLFFWYYKIYDIFIKIVLGKDEKLSNGLIS